MAHQLTALIPVHNDDYMLWFCLRSIAPYFAEIIVFNDGSFDNSREVVELVRKDHPRIQYHEHRGVPLGWAEARKKLISLAQGKHLFFIDADAVLLEYNAHRLQQFPEMAAVVDWSFVDGWADFDHTTQRLKRQDVCHVYVNREKVVDFDWVILDKSFASAPVLGTCDKKTVYDLMFWHARGVRPDWRILQQPQFNQWHARSRTGTPYGFLDELTPEQLHERAVHRLLTDREHHIRRYTGTPRRPAIIEAAERRFEMIYQDDQPVDRIDHGWWGLTDYRFERDHSLTAWDNFLTSKVEGIRLDRHGEHHFYIRNPETDTVLAANAVTALLLQLSNEGGSIGDIKAVVAELYGHGADLEADIMAGLRQLAANGFIQVQRG